MIPELSLSGAGKQHVGKVALVAILVFGTSVPVFGKGDGENRPLHPAGKGRPPNILIIVTDDQRAGTVRHMPKTVRWFGKGGIRFARAYVTTPVCCPSRSSIMTGRFAHNHRVLGNGHSRRLDHATTLQKQLRQAGYTTSLIGKFLNGWDARTDPPYLDRWAVLDVHTPYVRSLFNVDGRMIRAGKHSTAFIADQAARFLRDFEEHDGTPWLMYVSPYSPHEPFTPTHKNSAANFARYAGNPAVFESDRSDKPSWVRKQRSSLDDAGRVALKQRRSLLDVDDLVGEVFTTLNRLDETRNTLAFFLSDNGYMWGEHGLMGKFLPYLPSVRIPMYVRWPARLSKGAVDQRLAANIDLVPTALEAAGVPLPQSPTPDGRSLFGARRRRLLLEGWSVSRAPVWASLVTGRYQYIESYNDGDKRIFREYYRLASDPWELKNMVKKGRGISSSRLRNLALLLERARACRGAGCRKHT
jgi:arylsulfatase A-like enzyme